MTYELWYWDGIPGRGEFIRLALEAGGIAYEDKVRTLPNGDEALARDMARERPDAICGEERLHGHGHLAPECAVVVEHGDPFVLRHVVSAVVGGDALDEIEDGPFRGAFVPGGQGIGDRSGHMPTNPSTSST